MSDITIALTLDEAIAIEQVLTYVENQDGDCIDEAEDMRCVVSEQTDHIFDTDGLWGQAEELIPDVNGHLVMDEDEL